MKEISHVKSICDNYLFATHDFFLLFFFFEYIFVLFAFN